MDRDAKPEASSGGRRGEGPPEPPSEAGPGPTAEDLDALAGYAMALADGVEAAMPGWVERSVERVHVQRTGRRPPSEVRKAASLAAREAGEVVGPQVRALLRLDIDDQRTGPLALIRAGVAYPTRVLRDAGVPPADRDVFAVRQFPDDVYDLTPAAFADLDPALHETGLVWGAAKAHVHLARRRGEGRR